MKRVFRFLHISDLHLSLNHPLCPADAEKEKSETFYQLSLQALKNSVSLVNQQGLDALLIAGDLLEATRIQHRVIEDIFGALSECNAQVIISPGNHDLYSMTYKKERLDFYGISFPDNVHVYSSPTFSLKDIEGRNIYGMANTTREIKPFEECPEINTKEINIAMFHGSLLRFIPEGKELWLPFNEQELLEAGFDYVALGHYHGYSEVVDSQGTIRALYPGSLSPAGRNESGKRGGVLVEIEKSDDTSSVKVEFVTLSELMLKEISLTLTEEHSVTELERMVLSEVPKEQRPKTVLYIKAEGTGQATLSALSERLSEQFLHLEVDTSGLFSDNLDILLQMHNPETIVGRFIRATRDEMEKSDDAGKRILRNALLYGLDALKGREIEPRYEDKKIQG